MQTVERAADQRSTKHNHHHLPAKATLVRCTSLPVRTELYFFFQAEDGIRDLTVTGVQTCALPILAMRVIDQRRVGYDLPLSDLLVLLCHLLRANLIGFETEPLDRLLGQRDTAELRPLDALDLGGVLGLGLGRRNVFARRKLETGNRQKSNHHEITVEHRFPPLGYFCLVLVVPFKTHQAFAVTLPISSTVGAESPSSSGSRTAPNSTYMAGTPTRLSSA